MRISLAIAILFLLSGCSANYYLKRSQKLERKAIEKGAKVTVDTVYVDRQVIVPERHFDTLIQNVNFTDTITVIKDRVVTKVKINPIERTVYIDSKCLTDTVYVKVPVQVIKKIDTDSFGGRVLLYSFLFLLILAIIFGLTRFKVR